MNVMLLLLLLTKTAAAHLLETSATDVPFAARKHPVVVGWLDVSGHIGVADNPGGGLIRTPDDLDVGGDRSGVVIGPGWKGMLRRQRPVGHELWGSVGDEVLV